MARLISFVLISVAAASMLDLADDADGLILLQTNVGMVAGKALPEVAEVLSKPKAAFNDMSSAVTKLEQRLAEIQNQNAADVSAQRTAYAHNLTMQHNETGATEDFNANLETKILKLDMDISKLRSESTFLTKVNQGLVADMKTMQANLTVVQEFIGDALNSGSLMDTAHELDVLDELRQQEEARKQEDEHSNRLEAVSNGLTSLLELRSATRQRHAIRRPAELDPHGLLEAMDTALDQLALEQNASIASLRQQFMNDFEAGAEHRDTLLQHQAALNSSFAARTDLKAKLTVAVEHLGKAKGHLTQLIQSVRGFSKVLGDKPIPQERAFSMLQTGSERHGSQAHLPGMGSLLKRPEHAYNHVNQHVSDLADQLDAVNAESIEEAETQKVEYENQLQELKYNNTIQAEANDKVAEEITQLDKVIASWRSSADAISVENNKYRHDLETMQANMSLAQEYLKKSLIKTSEPFAETDELMVLDELEKQDEAHNAHKVHKKSLDEISPKVALLQMTDPHDNEGHARGLLKTLSISLDKLLEEHQASLDALKADFDKEFGKHMKHHEELVEEFSQLNQTRAAKTTLKSRLEVAEAHLKKTNLQLEKRRESFLAFARHLSQRPSPIKDDSHGSNIVDVANKVQAKVDQVDKAIEGPLDWLKNIAHNSLGSFAHED